MLPGDPAELMRAVVMCSFGGPEVLALRDVPMPHPGEGEVRIRVRAAFVARTRDVATRRRDHPVFSHRVVPPHILGGEHAGTVDAVGGGVPAGLLGAAVAVSASVECGDCVACRGGNPETCDASTTIGIERPGSNAEQVVVPAVNLQRIPADMSFSDAAVLAANGPLARAQLDGGGVAPGDWVLVPGASGSVGSLLVALSKRREARVIALARRETAIAPLKALGAEIVLDTERPDLSSTLLEHTDRGVDVVIDNLGLVGLWERYSPALARHGRVVFSGRVGDWDRPLPVDVGRLYLQGQSLIGRRTGDARHVAAFWAEIRASGLSIPEELVREFPLEHAAAAHLAIERGDKLGSYVLTVDGRNHSAPRDAAGVSAPGLGASRHAP